MDGDHPLKALQSLRGLTCCALLLLASHSAFAFNFTVNDTADAVDSTPGDGICETGPANGICTLRAAIQESNAWPGKDSIFIPAGTHILALSGLDDTAAAGDLDVTDALTLRGAGASSSFIDANSIDRVIDIHNVDVEIESLTIRNGMAVGSEGGGIRNVEGALTIRNMTLSNNQTTGNGFGGGGVYNTGPLIIDNATINTNRSSRGGGVLHFNRNMTISNSNIIDNLTDLGAGSGGGVFIQSDGNNVITNTTIDDNTAALGGGGGIYSVFGFTLTNSTVSNNAATQVGGGGIYDIGLGALIITNSTISGNTVGLGKGGGVHTRKSTAVITNSTIYNNYAGGIDNFVDTFNGYGGGIFISSGHTITLKNTIVSDNTSTYVAGHNCYSQTDGGAFSAILTTSEYTISDDNTCNLTGSGDQPNTDPSVTATLGFNGGATLTHTVGAASTAIDLGTNSGCPTTDQRSFPRPVNGGSSLTCDIGSVEHDPTASLADLSVLLEETMDPATNGSNFTYNITVTNNGPDAANNVVLNDLLDAGVTYVSDTAACNTGGLPAVSCALGTINAGNSQIVSITVRPNVPGLISNTASVSATESDPNAANNSATETTNVSGNSDLSATITGSVNPATANVAMTYTVTITNNGPDVATAVTPTIQFDTNIDLVNASPTVGSCSTFNTLGQVSCDLGDLANGASATISIQVIPLLQGLVTNTVYASFNGLDSNMANNSPSITTTVNASAALSITITDAPDPAFQNADIFYNFTVANSGPSTTHNTVLVVTFPPGVSLSPAPGASPVGCSGAGTVNCNLGSIVGSDSKTVTLVAIASSTGLFAVDASAISNETPVVLASESTLVNPAPTPTPPSADLLVTMVDAADPVVVGSGITYNITATNNNGPNVAQSVILTLTLPGATSFSSASAGCAHSGGLVSCNVGALSVGSSATVSVTVNTSITGTFSALATVSDSVGNDPVLSNNNVWQSTKVNANGSGGTAASRLNSGGGGAFALHEPAVLLFIAMVLFIRRRPTPPTRA